MTCEKAPRPPEWEGLNPEQLNDDILRQMPKGARLLEIGERERFTASKPAIHADLLMYFEGAWDRDCTGRNDGVTYATTRPRGWWKDKRARKALEASIEHRERIVAGRPGEVIGPNSCALCLEYNTLPSVSCKGCPVHAKTDQKGCRGSPYEELMKHLTSAHPGSMGLNVEECSTCVRLAREELKFLRSLLVEEKPKTVKDLLALPDEQIKELVKGRLDWAASVIPGWMCLNEPEYMAKQYPFTMYLLTPSSLYKCNPEWMRKNVLCWVLNNRLNDEIERDPSWVLSKDPTALWRYNVELAAKTVRAKASLDEPLPK